MDVILLENIDKVGDKHTIVKVKDGFGRNYLIPQGKAIIANKSNRARLAELRRIEELREFKKLSEYQQMASALEGKTIKIDAKAGTSGKIFGSVTNVQIAQAIRETHEIEVDRRKIEIPIEVKELGEYKAVLKLHPEVETEITFEVVQA